MTYKQTTVEEMKKVPLKAKNDKWYLKETSELIEMMGYPRPSDEMEHEVYQEFLKRFIEPVFGKPDPFGNYVHIILDKTMKANPIEGNLYGNLKITEQFPRVCYMSHHDTVHTKSTLRGAPHGERIVYTSYPHPSFTIKEKLEKRPNIKNPYLNDHEKYQSVEVFNSLPRKIKIEEVRTVNILNEDGTRTPMPDMTTTVSKEINNPEDVNLNCLGADCTVGIWIQLQMIRAQVPGVYVVHAKEEIGRKGAEFIVKKHKECIEAKKPSPYYWIDLMDIAMSFDRKGFNEIITHQSGKTRCASDEFADSLSDLLSSHLVSNGYPNLIKSDKGSFTDSYSYKDLIPECINLCVGYDAQHTARESQDVRFAYHLAQALIKEGHDINDPDGVVTIQRDIVEEKKPVTKHSVVTHKPKSAYTSISEFGRQVWEDDENPKPDSSKKDEGLKKKSDNSSHTEHKTEDKEIDHYNESHDFWYFENDWTTYENRTYTDVKQTVLSGKEISPDDERQMMIGLFIEEPRLMAEFMKEIGYSIKEIVEYVET